jgi:hypothetical protein
MFLVGVEEDWIHHTCIHSHGYTFIEYKSYADPICAVTRAARTRCGERVSRESAARRSTASDHSGHITRYPLPEPELPGTEPKLPEPVLPDANSGSESNYPKFYWVNRVVRPGTRTTRSTRTLQTSMIPLLAGWPGPTSAQVGIPSIMLLCRTRTTLLYCYSTSTCMFVVENFISIMLLKNSIMFEVFLSNYKFWVEREYPNPNPKIRVPAISGTTISGLTSGNRFQLPELFITRTTRPDRIG